MDLTLLLASMTAVSFALYGLATYCTYKHTSIRDRFEVPSLPPLTLIKPICGFEEHLAENLKSFFEQAYPAPFEIVFASTDPCDPGMAVARRVAKGYPNVPAHFVLSDPEFGLNPKVANLAGALKGASHDLVLHTDANVRARAGLVRDLAAEYQCEKASLLGGIVVGVGERSIGATLENFQLSAFSVPLVCGALHLFKRPCLIGKLMLLKRSELEQLGGLAEVKDILAEDYFLGELYQRAGKRVVISSSRVENVNIRSSTGDFVRRHSRWLKMRLAISPAGYILDLLVNPTPFAMACLASCGFSRPLGLILPVLLTARFFIDGAVVRRTRGSRLRPILFWVPPLRHFLHVAIWLSALFGRSTRWRGQTLRLGADSRLIGPKPAPEFGPLERQHSEGFGGAARTGPSGMRPTRLSELARTYVGGARPARTGQTVQAGADGPRSARPAPTAQADGDRQRPVRIQPSRAEAW